jgi:hypothetical protein
VQKFPATNSERNDRRNLRKSLTQVEASHQECQHTNFLPTRWGILQVNSPSAPPVAFISIFGCELTPRPRQGKEKICKSGGARSSLAVFRKNITTPSGTRPWWADREDSRQPSGQGFPLIGLQLACERSGKTVDHRGFHHGRPWRRTGSCGADPLASRTLARGYCLSREERDILLPISDLHPYQRGALRAALCNKQV